MKTSNSSNRNEQIFVIKQIFFALQILIICAAIPVLSYLQLTHKSSKVESDTHTAAGMASEKHNSTTSAANTATAIILAMPK
jgi:hypothetical protein